MPAHLKTQLLSRQVPMPDRLEITQRVGAGDSLESFERPLIEKLRLMVGNLSAELINRFDEIVLFRPLNKEELAQVASLMLGRSE
jgi:ATP-dependent Clp protease ATP-binding subunit ClpA